MAKGVCDLCGIRPATVRAEVVSNGERRTMELCDVDYRRLARQQRPSSQLESLFGGSGGLFEDFFGGDFFGGAGGAAQTRPPAPKTTACLLRSAPHGDAAAAAAAGPA
jgi:ATP-dependent Clp protease ATP-binding subunit ClpC